MDKMFRNIGIAVVVVFALLFGGYHTPFGRAITNSHFGFVQEIDDKTNYKTLKQVENACKSMIASYKSDKLTYQQYKDSDSKEKQNWAEQAKMRANNTASSYNNYILKNSYIWEDNIPIDITKELQLLN